MSDEQVIDAGVREDFRLGERRTGQADGAVGHLPLSHVRAFVGLGVRPQLYVVVSGELGHAGEIALDDFFIDHGDGRDDVFGRRQDALDVHSLALR